MLHCICILIDVITWFLSQGEKEMFVSAELIKSLEAGPSPSRMGGGGGGGRLREGMKVEARYRGKARYYPGVIKRENRDGTFDIDYDDVSASSLHLTYLCSLYSWIRVRKRCLWLPN